MWPNARLSFINEMMKTFNAKDNVLPSYFPGVLYRSLLSKGFSSEALLRKTRFTPEMFNEEELRFNFTEIQRLILNAMHTTHDPNLGFWFGNRINFTSLGMVGMAAVSTATFEDALNTTIKFFKLRDPIWQLSLEKSDNDCALCFSEALDLGEIRYFMHTAALSGAYQLLQYFLGVHKLDAIAEFALDNKGDFDPSKSEVPFQVRFNKMQSRLCFNSDILSQPMPMANPQTANSAEKYCEKQLENFSGADGIVGRVRGFIEKCFSNKDAAEKSPPNLKNTAALCAVSERTLRRELAKSNTHFQAILDDVRKTLAIAQLKHSDLPIAHIAFNLGFQDLSNFRRAFKKWTGTTPTKYRKNEIT